MVHLLTDHWLSDGIMNALGQGAPSPPGLRLTCSSLLATAWSGVTMKGLPALHKALMFL